MSLKYGLSRHYNSENNPYFLSMSESRHKQMRDVIKRDWNLHSNLRYTKDKIPVVRY